MKASDIKVGHVYYVTFEPTRKGEFDRYHMAVVLKKTINEITFIVIPLTSNSDGDGRNKVRIDIREQLPTNLKEQNKETYAVYDQVRTLNASRFRELMEDNKPLEVVVSSSDMDTIYSKIVGNLLSGMDKQHKNAILDKAKNC